LASSNNSKAPLRRRWLWPTLAVVAVGLLFVYLRPSPLRVRAATVQRGPIRSVVSTNGKIEPIQNFEPHTPISTNVKRLLVKEGNRVRKGQLLLQLDDADIRSQAARAQALLKAAQADQSALSSGGTQEEVITLDAQLVKARSDLDVAQHNLDALHHLQQQGAASPGEVRLAEDNLQARKADLTLLEQKKKERYSNPEVAKVQAQVVEAQAAYDAAEDALSKSNVRAPFDGIVYSLPVTQGAFVHAGDLLLQEADLSHVLVRAFVDEPDIGRLQHGQRIEITWDAVPGRIWVGEVTTIPSTVRQVLARHVGEITFTVDNKDLKLLPNVNVGVTVIISEHDNVLTLQRDALHADDDNLYVYRIVGGRLKRQSVSISLQNLTRVEITSGLSEGSSVALPAEESKPLFDGAAVKVVP
jgi:HlyD family secretion protein